LEPLSGDARPVVLARGQLDDLRVVLGVLF
jgi:hypothetical protein